MGRLSKEKNDDMKAAANDEEVACDGEQEGIFHGGCGYDRLDCNARGVEADTCRMDDDLVCVLHNMVTRGENGGASGVEG